MRNGMQQLHGNCASHNGHCPAGRCRRRRHCSSSSHVARRLRAGWQRLRIHHRCRLLTRRYPGQRLKRNSNMQVVAPAARVGQTQGQIAAAPQLPVLVAPAAAQSLAQ